ncbi:MAG TPA: HNH endonuclease signature motif containing protein [archaeon]|nr:HNH endonuclease signature motif containing protein [archaeon]
MHIDVNCMSQNSFGFGLKSTGFRIQTQKASWRTLGIRNKQILYRRAKGKCEACGRKIDFDEMHSGHKNAASKGGSATLRNSVCICARCNKLQGTDSWATFMKKMGKSNTRSVTSGKKRSTSKKKPRRKAQSENYWTNPITGRKEKIRPPFKF